MDLYEHWAREFHDTYERLAPEYGYKTREASAVPWQDVPEQNKALMVATVSHVMQGAVSENERLRAFAFGDAPEWEKANATLKHRVRELEAELATYRGAVGALRPYLRHTVANCVATGTDNKDRCVCGLTDTLRRLAGGQ